MRKPKHIEIVLAGSERIEQWTGANHDTVLDLREAELAAIVLEGANLRAADLSWANLSNADLSRAFLSDADLTNADLTNASGNSASNHCIFSK